MSEIDTNSESKIFRSSLVAGCAVMGYVGYKHDQRYVYFRVGFSEKDPESITGGYRQKKYVTLKDMIAMQALIMPQAIKWGEEVLESNRELKKKRRNENNNNGSTTANSKSSNGN